MTDMHIPVSNEEHLIYQVRELKEQIESLKDAILSLHCKAVGGYCVECYEAGGEDGAPNWPCRTAQLVVGND